MPGLLSRTTEAFWALLDPWSFIFLSLCQIPPTIGKLFHTLPPVTALLTILSPSEFRFAWFSQFWALVGPGIREDAGHKVLPLLEGRTVGGRAVMDPVRAGVGGVVIEIGPGSGLWADVFSERYLSVRNEDVGTEQRLLSGSDASSDTTPDLKNRRPDPSTTPLGRTKITRVYGIEPNTSHHASLRQSIIKSDLQDIYEIVPVGIEDLSSSKWQGGPISPGTVDCIVSVLCLCSIPEPERHTKELYGLLKPGGRWFVYEHVRVEGGWWLRGYQRIINLVWPTFIGGCEMCRPTETTLRNAGPWTSVDVGQPPVEPWYHLLPHILGVFTK